MIKNKSFLVAFSLFVALLQPNLRILFADEALAVNNVVDWAYQLQEYDKGLSNIKDSKYDLIVMDYSFSGGTEDEFTKDEIDVLKFNGACERKIILSYMSIGEAEEFRFYFDDMPKDLLFKEPNPQFPDNIKVRFWDDRWKKIIFGNADDTAQKSYLDRIIDAGFDGIYLDIIDAYEFWGPKDIDGNGERETAAVDMIDFVASIAEYARDVRGKKNFIVVPQNGAGIIDSSSYPFADDPEKEANTQKQKYFNVIDAIGAEDTFFFGNRDNNNILNIQDDTVELLNQFRDAGKVVLSVDYVQTQEKIDEFYNLASGEGYVPYATTRELDTLIINNTHEPICNSAVGNGEPPESPTLSPTPIETSTPLPAPTPSAGKQFSVNCDQEFTKGPANLDKIIINIGQEETCSISLALNSPEMKVKVVTNIKPGMRKSIIITPSTGATDVNGELQFTITATKKGIDWVAWAIPNEKGKINFSRKSYDSGFAWGMFVEVE